MTAKTKDSPFSWRFVAPLYMGSTLNPINSSMIATALVPIATHMHVSVAQVTILVTVLYLASAIAQPTSGKLAAELGPRRIFLVGILLIFLGGLLGGFGHNLLMLILSRILIGIGTSTAYPSAMLLIRRRAEWSGMQKPPGNVLGGLQIAGVVTSALGLPIGGVLVDAWGWRTVFFVNIPFSLIALVMTMLWIPRDVPMKGAQSVRTMVTRIDIPGIVGFALTIGSLMFFLFSLPHADWVALGTSIVLCGLLILWESKAKNPFIDVRMLASNLALSRTYVRFAAMTLCMYTVLYGITEWIGAVRSASALEAGLLILPMSIVSALVVGPISKRNLVRGPLMVAAGSSIVASIGVLFLTMRSPVVWIILITCIFGVMMGAASSGNQTALYMQVSTEHMGTASGLLRTFGYIGSIASSAFISVVFHRSVSDSGLHHIAVIMIAVSIIAFVITIADPRLQTPPKQANMP